MCLPIAIGIVCRVRFLYGYQRANEHHFFGEKNRPNDTLFALNGTLLERNELKRPLPKSLSQGEENEYIRLMITNNRARTYRLARNALSG
ncbi:MAG: hypothetical protein PHV20_02125 [Bacteroidales bacterium]|nr:hypothetical protein [Bacteroidales bacterium]